MMQSKTLKCYVSRQLIESRLILSLIVGIFSLSLCVTSARVSADDLPPVLDFSTYLGGNQSDAGSAVALDPQGNIYVTGSTQSPNFPALNPLNSVMPSPGIWVVYVTKYDPTGTTVIYSTLLGVGESYGIAVDSDGFAYVGGTTSAAIPLKNPMQPSIRGGIEGFVAKLNRAGNALVYSTYLGGSDNDMLTGIALDAARNVIVVGSTKSSDFPIRFAFQSSLGSSVEKGFLSKLNAAGNALLYSTYFGGSVLDGARGVAVDKTGNAYITGSATSQDLPTLNPAQANPACVGCVDAFVAKFNPSGVLVYSTYLGGGGDIEGDGGNAIAVDAAGSAYVTGKTESNDFPLVNAYQDLEIPVHTSIGFVTKFSPDGSHLVYSTYLGGTGSYNFAEGTGIAVDIEGHVYVTGVTAAGDFPTMNPIQAVLAGSVADAADAYLSELSSDGQNLLFSTYLGGSAREVGYPNIALNPLGSVIITGSTFSADFPLRFAQQGIPGGSGSGEANDDAFVAKISVAPIVAETSAPETHFFLTNTPTLTWTGLTDAIHYHIQVDGSPLFNAPLDFEATVDGNTLTVTTNPLTNGRHYWRIQAQNKNGLWTGWSTVQSFTVWA